MFDSKAFATNFAGHPVPEELQKLLAFEAALGPRFYSDGFELAVDDKAGIASWSKDPEFLAPLMPFAQANGSGSFYALWANTPGNPSEMPVIVFGDEGGVHVIAENLRDLLRLLTWDSEPMVDHGGVSFYRDEDSYEPSVGHAAFTEWLKTELGLEPVDDPDPIVERAGAKYGAAFQQWMRRFVSE